MTVHQLDHREPTLPIDQRVDLLVERMPVREKCWQLVSVAPWSLVRPGGGRPDRVADLLEKAPGHVAGVIADDPRVAADLVARLQYQAINHTRLGIPLLIHAEALNGFMSGGHMVFPTGIGLAATWSPDLVQDMADLIRRQMCRIGVRQALAPVMDVALDPRWGRVHETYGEDPYLCAALSVGFTLGLQGDDLRGGVIATAKHFLGYGLPEGGINLSGVETGTRRLRDLFAFPFEAAIQLGSLASVMNSYADIDRVPVAVAPEILTDLLRSTLGFDGFVSSDYMTLEHLVTRQQVAADPAEAGRLAMAAGLDVEFPTPFGYGDVLAGEVAAGRVEHARVEAAVRRVLRAKFALGLFENPYPAERIDVAAVAEEGADLSAELARRSVVLVKNHGLLPLGAALRVAVVGPHADAVTLQFPTYTYPAAREMVAVMAAGGFGNAVGVDPAMASWANAVQSPKPAEEFVRSEYHALSLTEVIAARAATVVSQPGCGLTGPRDGGALDRAVQAACEADVAVLALGGASLWFNGDRTEGEASDSADIALPAVQQELAEAVAATGTPMVVVLVQGRAYTLPDAVTDAAAIVVSTYGGPFGPGGVAEVLFGETNPSGKLPYSIPRHTGQIPVYHHQVAGSGQRNPVPPGVSQLYLDQEATPLVAFGHGLSYTTFGLSDSRADLEIDTTGVAEISTTVSNTGDRAGATTVQLYLRINTSAVTRPAQQLAGFTRVELSPGQSQRVSFAVQAAQLGYTNLARRFVVEPARVDWVLGLASDDRQAEGSFQVRGEPRHLASAGRAYFSAVSTASLPRRHPMTGAVSGVQRAHASPVAASNG
jgi:beta-glucosidase-like glycosyl hydrolase